MAVRPMDPVLTVTSLAQRLPLALYGTKRLTNTFIAVAIQLTTGNPDKSLLKKIGSEPKQTLSETK